MYIPSKAGLILHDVEAQGNNFIYTHVQDVAPVQQEVAWLRMNSDRGFTQGRTLQHVGKIPDSIYFAHPEFYGEDGADNMIKWLKTEEGRPYRIANNL